MSELHAFYTKYRLLYEHELVTQLMIPILQDTENESSSRIQVSWCPPLPGYVCCLHHLELHSGYQPTVFYLRSSITASEGSRTSSPLTVDPIHLDYVFQYLMLNILFDVAKTVSLRDDARLFESVMGIVRHLFVVSILRTTADTAIEDDDDAETVVAPSRPPPRVSTPRAGCKSTRLTV